MAAGTGARHETRSRERESRGRHGRPQHERSAPLACGWYRDPYERWTARFWDGERWTAKVANRGPDPAQPEYGNDPISVADLQAEVTRLRAEAESWRRIAEDRRRALDALEPIARLYRATSAVDPRSKTSKTANSALLPVPADRVAVPAHVREAAAWELAVVEARLRTRRGNKRQAGRSSWLFGRRRRAIAATTGEGTHPEA
jgi:hypothetical protein